MHTGEKQGTDEALAERAIAVTSPGKVFFSERGRRSSICDAAKPLMNHFQVSVTGSVRKPCLRLDSVREGSRSGRAGRWLGRLGWDC